MNYYLDKTVDINGTFVVKGSIISIKTEKTFNKYTDLIKLTSLFETDKEINDVDIDGNLIIREYKDFFLNVKGSSIVNDHTTLE